MNTLFKLTSLSAAIFLTACGGGSNSNNGGSDTGQLSVGITDGPVEGATEVVVSFTAIELQGAEKKTIELCDDDAVEPCAAATLNLLDYQGEDRLLLLDDETLLAGDYQWMRLAVDEAASYIVVEGQQYALEIPSGAQSGLKLNRGFTIGAGTTTDFTIDFDLRKSVHQEGTGDYKLRPTLRLVDNLEVNTIRGTVAASLVEDTACNNGDNNDTGNAVYLFSYLEGGIAPAVQDLQGNDGDPLTTATVSFNADSGDYEFTIGYVPLADYSIAFSCDVIDDDALLDNSVGNSGGNPEVAFSQAIAVSVSADSASVVAIP